MDAMASLEREASDPDHCNESSEVRATIATNMRRARLAHGLSMRELSEHTRISTALLSQVERGAANTTVDTLAKIAAALDLSFADLTWRFQATPLVVRSNEGAEVRHGNTVVRTLFGSTDRRRFEVSVGTIEAHSISPRSTHGVGSVEYAFVISGNIVIETPEWTVHLETSEAARFSGAEEHSYRTFDEGAEILTLVSSADDWTVSDR